MTVPPESFSAVLVGLGQIGMGYDRHLPAMTHVLSHTRALLQHPRFRLLAAIEPDPALRQQFSAHTGLPAYDHIANLPDPVQADVVIVASPTATHPAVLCVTAAVGAPGSSHVAGMLAKSNSGNLSGHASIRP